MKIHHEKAEWVEERDGQKYYFRQNWCGTKHFSEYAPDPPDPNKKPNAEMPWHDYWDNPIHHCKNCLREKDRAGKPYVFKARPL